MSNFQNKKFVNREGGFIKYIVIIVAALILIAYFRKDIQKLWETPGIKNALLTAIGWISQALSWLIGKLNWTAGQIK